MIDIIIPFYNQYMLVTRCLKSVEASGYSEGRIILVNDGSDDREFILVKELCSRLNLDIQLLSHKSNRGFKESIMTGLSECDLPYVILLNNDTVVPPDFATMMLDVMRKNDEIKAVAPVSNNPTDLYQFRKQIYKEMKHNNDEELYTTVTQFPHIFKKQSISNITFAPYLTGMCLAIDREIFKRVGYFEDTYEHGFFEDLHLSCQIRDLGFKLAIREDCFVFHEGHCTYREKTGEEKVNIIMKNYEIFCSHWKHLPEHNNLLKRMEFAGKECPI